MLLEDLDKKYIDINVLILQTPSNRLNLFVEDKLRRRLKSTGDTIIEVDSKDKLKQVKELQGIIPPLADKWLVKINLSKYRDKEIYKVIKTSPTCTFLLTSDRYMYFKTARQELQGMTGLQEYYVYSIRRRDFLYLYDAFVQEKYRLPKVLFDYVVQNYSDTPDVLFDLMLELNAGVSITSRTDIAKICGIGNNSVETFILQMVKGLSGSAIGLKTVMRTRIKAGVDLGEALGYNKFYNYMNKSLMNFIQIRVLIISAVVYKDLHDLPDEYEDKKTLVRYQKYMYKIKEIPLSRFLRLKTALIASKPWQSELDFISFLYRYYDDEVKLGDYNTQKEES